MNQPNSLCVGLLSPYAPDADNVSRYPLLLPRLADLSNRRICSLECIRYDGAGVGLAEQYWDGARARPRSESA